MQIVSKPQTVGVAPLPHVVVVGAGFAGLTLTKALAHAPVRVTLIDKRNHHLFQPLLYQVATSGLSPAQIAAPIRSIVRDQRNVTVLMGEVAGVDAVNREVTLEDRRIPFDYLVVATGARHSYFGHDDWEPYAPGLKSLEDATALRRRILLAFEQAESEPSKVEQARLLTFIVIGAGPTGVELAGAIASISRHVLPGEFRNFDPRSARILLVEAGPRVLSAFPEELSGEAKRRLEKLGVEVRLGQPVVACDATGATIGGTRVPSQTIIWAAGVAASPAAQWLGAAADRAGRVIVRSDFAVPGHANIFVIGDTASATDATGKVLPGLAPVAKQQGSYVACVIEAKTLGKPAPAAFVYNNAGNLATIGRNAAVVDFGWLRLKGFVAWVLWSAVHIFFLIGFRNRLIVFFEWFWAYLTFQRSARLITGAPAVAESRGPRIEETREPRTVDFGSKVSTSNAGAQAAAAAATRSH